MLTVLSIKIIKYSFKYKTVVLLFKIIPKLRCKVDKSCEFWFIFI